MSLQNILTENRKSLLLEMSKGKQKALLDKMIDHMYDRYLDNTELVRLMKDSYNEYYMVWDFIYNNMEGIAKYFPTNISYKNDIIDTYSGSLNNFDIIMERSGFLEEYDSRVDRNDIIYGMIFICSVLESLEKADPTGNMKYGNWLVDEVFPYMLEKGFFGGKLQDDNFYNARQAIVKNNRFFDDIPKLENYLEYYHEAKEKNELPDEYKDINQLLPVKVEDPMNGISERVEDPFDALRYVTEEYRTIETEDFFGAVDSHLNEGKDYELVDELQEWVIYEPLTQKGASILGMNTEWCTTYGEHCTNPDYQGRRSAFDSQYDELRIFVNKKDTDYKLQMDIDDGEFRDQHDNWANMGELDPQLVEYIIDKEWVAVPSWLEHKEGEKWYVDDRNAIVGYVDSGSRGEYLSSEAVDKLINGEGYQYFMDSAVGTDMEDLYHKYYNDQTVVIVKEAMINIAEDMPDYFEEESEYTLEDIENASDLEDLGKIAESSDVLFDDLNIEFENAVATAQTLANEREAIDTIWKTFQNEWGIYDISWDGFYVDEITAYEMIEAYNDQYSDTEDRLMVKISQPRYGFQGDIDPDQLNEELYHTLSQHLS